MRVILTPDDLKKGDLMEPGWWPAEISNYEEAEASDNAKNPGSTNCIFDFKVIDGPNKGMMGRRYFNETAMGFGKSLWATLGFPKTASGGYEISTQLLEQTVGHKLMIYVKRGKNPQTKAEFNDVSDFKPMS